MYQCNTASSVIQHQLRVLLYSPKHNNSSHLDTLVVWYLNWWVKVSKVEIGAGSAMKKSIDAVTLWQAMHDDAMLQRSIMIVPAAIFCDCRYRAILCILALLSVNTVRLSDKVYGRQVHVFRRHIHVHSRVCHSLKIDSSPFLYSQISNGNCLWKPAITVFLGKIKDHRHWGNLNIYVKDTSQQDMKFHQL